jgi:hypothetical protein
MGLVLIMLVYIRGSGLRSGPSEVEDRCGHRRSQSELLLPVHLTLSHSNSHALWSERIKYMEPSVPYDEIMASEDGVAEWTALIVRPLLG